MTEPVLIRGDCMEWLPRLPDGSVDACVTDPPYHLSTAKRFGADNAAPAKSNGATGVYKRASAGFMGQQWDGGDIAFRPEMWAEVLRVLKPGGHLVAFGGSRTYHRLACAVEDAGFEIRDQIMWLYGSGFPKSLNVSKAIDKAAGADREVVGVAGKSGSGRNCMAGNFAGGEYMETAPSTPEAQQWQGWGTALKPAHEPIVLARKPFKATVAKNLAEHGCGALNIDGCRVPVDPSADASQLRIMQRSVRTGDDGWGMSTVSGDSPPVVREEGRWPANVCHDGSDEVAEAFPDSKGQQGDVRGSEPSGKTKGVFGDFAGRTPTAARNDTGSAARFFYCAKASKKDRGEGNNHPTVKPTALMQWLCRLITPPGGVVLDPFMGSGSTGKAATREGFGFIGIEQDEKYMTIAKARVRT